MCFSERLKELVERLQHAVFDHQDKIHSAVDTVGNVANKTTKGKFEDKITKAGEMAHAGVGKVAGNPDGSATTATDAEGASGAAGSEATAAEGDGESSTGEAAGSADGHEDQPSESSAATQEEAD
jgi:hypothetical protein